MTEQEFRKLKALDLIQILLTQGAETARQHENLEEKNKQLNLLLEENDIIKAKLNDRDAMTELIKQKLNESDEYIRKLEKKMKRLYTDKRIALAETGSLVQAALELNKIFETAQKEAEQYIQNAGPLLMDAEAFLEMDIDDITDEEIIEKETLEEQKTELSGETKEPEPEAATEPEEPEPEAAAEPEEPEPETATEPEEPESETATEPEEPESEEPKPEGTSEEKPEESSEETLEEKPEESSEDQPEPEEEPEAKPETEKTSEEPGEPAEPEKKGLFGFLRRWMMK